jgi:hypothetical protein
MLRGLEREQPFVVRRVLAQVLRFILIGKIAKLAWQNFEAFESTLNLQPKSRADRRIMMRLIHFLICHRSLQNQLVRGEPKPATPRCFIHIKFLYSTRALRFAMPTCQSQWIEKMFGRHPKLKA